MVAADPASGAGKLALHVHCSFSRQRMRLPETTNNWPPVIKTPNFIISVFVPGVESCPCNKCGIRDSTVPRRKILEATNLVHQFCINL